MATFPHALCAIRFGDHAEQESSTVLRSQVERGIPRQRRFQADSLVSVSCTLLFKSRAAADDWRLWFGAEGYGWFDFTLPRTGQVVTARIVGGDIGQHKPRSPDWAWSERSVVIEYVRPSFIQLAPGSHDVNPSRVLSVQRASTGTFIDSNGVLQTAAANVARWQYGDTKNIYGSDASLVGLNGVYGDARLLKSGSINPAHLQPGQQLTVSADLWQDAASAADGAGRVARLILWTADAANVWKVSAVVDMASTSPTRVSAALTLPADADMHSVGVGVWHVGGSSSYLGTVHADRIMVTRDGSTDYVPAINLLVDPARTNLLAAPEAFDSTAWTKQGTTVTPGLWDPAPNGVQYVADAFMETSANSQHDMYAAGSGLGDSFSVFVKYAGVRFVALYGFQGGVTFGQTFDLLSGVLASPWSVGSPLSTIMRPLDNGWWRIGVRAASAFGVGVISLCQSDATAIQSYAGNPANGVYLWGAQLEAGGITSYTPNSRAADLITVMA